MADIQAIGAKVNRDLANGLIRNLKAMPTEKQTWRPLDSGRSALDQVQECAVINAWAAEIFRTRSVPTLGGDEFSRMKTENDTAEKACSALESATGVLSAAILAFPATDLDETVKLPWDEMESTFGELFLVPYWNMAYHLGQVCYIQTLYGDTDFH